MSKKWYSIKAFSAAAGQAVRPPEIDIFDDIGYWGVTAKQFVTELKAIVADKIIVNISSNGGSVFDALVMYNALRAHAAEIEVHILGVAASAASVVAMAGDKIMMPENAFMMVHQPLNVVYGNADDMREMADILDKVSGSLMNIYCARTGKDIESVKALLDDETYLTAAEAIEFGFADELQPELRVAASFDLERVPENIRALIAPVAAADGKPAGQPEGAQDDPVAAARQLTASILAKASAAGLVAHADAFLLDATITNEAEAETAIAEAKEVLAVCEAAKLPDMAGKLIKARVPLATVRDRLMEAQAALDAATSVNHQIPQPAAATRPTIDTQGIYAKRRST